MLKRTILPLLCACTVANAAIMAGGDMAFYTVHSDEKAEMKVAFVPYLKFNESGPWSARLKLVIAEPQRAEQHTFGRIPVLFEFSAPIWKLESLPIQVRGSVSSGACLHISSAPKADFKLAYEALLSFVVDARSEASFRAFIGYASFGEAFEGDLKVSLSGLTLGLGANLKF